MNEAPTKGGAITNITNCWIYTRASLCSSREEVKTEQYLVDILRIMLNTNYAKNENERNTYVPFFFLNMSVTDSSYRECAVTVQN